MQNKSYYMPLRYFHTAAVNPTNRRHIRSSSQETGSPTRIKNTKVALCICVCVCVRARAFCERARGRACAREETG